MPGKVKALPGKSKIDHRFIALITA